MKQTCLVIVTLALFVATTVTWYSSSNAAQEAHLHAHLFEMRTYHCHPGRLGALHKRFREHTNYLFVKHGITLVGYWTPTDTADTLVYMLAYADREAREESWKGFLNDPDWKKVYEESHKDGPIVAKVDSQFLNPTDYSPLR